MSDKDYDLDQKARQVAISELTALGESIVIVVDEVRLSSIIVSANGSQDRETTGVVMSVGPDVKIDVKEHDRVLFAMHAGKPMRFGTAAVKRVTADQVHIRLHRPTAEEIQEIKKLAAAERLKKEVAAAEHAAKLDQQVKSAGAIVVPGIPAVEMQGHKLPLQGVVHRA